MGRADSCVGVLTWPPGTLWAAPPGPLCPCRTSGSPAPPACPPSHGSEPTTCPPTTHTPAGATHTHTQGRTAQRKESQKDNKKSKQASKKGKKTEEGKKKRMKERETETKNTAQPFKDEDVECKARGQVTSLSLESIMVSVWQGSSPVSSSH